MKINTRLISILAISALLLLSACLIFAKAVISRTSFNKFSNILLLGTDQEVSKKGHIDAIILAHLNFESKEVYLIPIPRDSLVEIPGVGYGKITTTGTISGPKLTATTVEKLLKTPIPYYMQVDFNGFKKVIDNLGGVEIEVEKTIDDRTPGYCMYIPSGQQQMDGNLALNYVRYRHGDPAGGLARIDRQQRLLQAVFKKVQTSRKLPTGLISLICKDTETNLSIIDAFRLIWQIGPMKGVRIKVLVLPGETRQIKGVYYYVPKFDSERAAYLKQLISEKKGGR